MRNIIRRVISGLLIGGMLICPTFAASFPDVDDSAAYVDAVEYVSELGIMVGDSNGNFNPDQAVTRAEMAALVCRMLGETENLQPSDEFSDVPETHWANEYIARASELEIVNGYGDGTFGPSTSLTYEQAETMVIRAVGGEQESVDAGGYPEGYLTVATRYDLLKNIESTSGMNMPRSDIAVLIYNCLN